MLAECILGFELLPFNTCYNDEKVTKPVAEAMARLANQAASPADVVPYDTLFKDVRGKAPYATRVAVGYPEFYPEDGGDRTFLPGGRCEGVKKADQRWMVEQIDKLNGIIAGAAKRNGLRFANPSSRFEGHELCSGGEEWMAGLLSSGRFHPTIEGQQAIGDAVLAALQDDTAEGPSYTVRKNETVSGGFAVALGQALLTVIAQWPGSDVPLTLISPSGVRYTRDDPGAGVSHSVGETFEQFEIPNPEPGEWRTELFGKDVSPGGEPVTLLPTTEPFPNVAPTAKISYVDNGDGTLTFSSAQSEDRDGQITRREWYVSNSDDDERHVEGDTVTVPVQSGEKNVTLVVTDDRRDVGFASVGIPKNEPTRKEPPTVIAGNSGPPVKAVKDLVAPRITKLALQRAVRRGKKKTVWKGTKSLKGNVRLRLTVSEPAKITLQVRSARTPTKQKTATIVVAKAGTVTVRLRRLVSGLRSGKATLAVSAKDAAGNTSKKTLRVKR